jgi:uncharacterized membrane protein
MSGAPPPGQGGPPPGHGAPPPGPGAGGPPPGPGGPGGDLRGVRPQADNDKLIGALCYIFWFLVPIIILVTDMKNSRFAKVHAYQGLVFGGAGLAYGILFCVCLSVIGFALGGGFIAAAVQCVLWVFALVPAILGIYFAYLVYTKEQVVLPYVTDVTRSVFKDL